MVNAWLAPPVLTGLASLIVSGVGLFFVMRVDRRQRGADAPAIDVELMRSTELKDVLELRVVVRNKTDSAWVLEHIGFRDRDVSCVLARDTREIDRAGGARYSLDRAARLAKEGGVIANLRVEPVGAARTRVSWGDHAHERVFLFFPSSLSSLSMRLSLRSLDAKPRSITIPVKRAVPPSISSAMD